eukprot:7317633-Heterocapsa_arctica.AAC.1
MSVTDKGGHCKNGHSKPGQIAESDHSKSGRAHDLLRSPSLGGERRLVSGSGGGGAGGTP